MAGAAPRRLLVSPARGRVPFLRVPYGAANIFVHGINKYCTPTVPRTSCGVN